MKKKNNKKRIIKFLSGCLLMAYAAFFCVQYVYAQNSAAPQLRLTNDQSAYKLSPYIDVTRDYQKALNFNIVYQRYRKGQYGERLGDDIMPLGQDQIPYWMIFEVQNLSDVSEWVLSFGNRLDGRTGLIKEMLVYEHSAQTRYIDTLTKASDAPSQSKLSIDSAVNVQIPSGQKSLFFVYLVPESGVPLTLAPRLLTEDAYRELLTSPLSFRVIATFMIAATIGIFIGLLLLRSYWRSLLLITYLLTQASFAFYLNDAIYSSFPLANTVSGWIFSIAAILALITSRQFLRLDASQRLAARLLFVFTTFVGVSALAGTLNLPPHVKAATLYGPALLAYLFLFLLSAAQSYVGKAMALRLSMAWLLMFLGGMVSALTIYNILPPVGVLAKAYWYAIGLHCLLLIYTAIGQVNHDEDQKREAEVRSAEEEESLKKLQQNKGLIENQRLKRMIEHERAAMNELRDREIQQKEEMRRAKEVADEANRAKSAFLAVVSHEIRTPMTGVMGMVRLLLDTTLSSKQIEYAQTIQDSGDAMLALLNDILDFEKIESGNLDLELIDFDLHRLIQGISTLMSGHAAAKNIYLKIDTSPDLPQYVVGDPVRLRQVLLNLIGNSIKFTEQGGVTLSVKIDPAGKTIDQSYPIRFSVIDTGVGISREAQAKLFNPFSQADSSVTRKFGGTGLGLAISQRLIEAMGGKIRIESVEREGSTFYFSVNLAQGSAEAAINQTDQSSAKEQTTKAQRILIVEDNEINRKLLKEFVERMGHQIMLASTGEEALDMVNDNTFDLVLMDMELPGLSGMGTTKAIRALPDKSKATLPVIALTGNIRDEDIRKCYAANMNGHIAKPVDPKKLKNKINNIAEGKLDNPVMIDGREIDILSVERPAGPLKVIPKTEKPASPTPIPVSASEPIDLQIADEEDVQAATLPSTDMAKDSEFLREDLPATLLKDRRETAPIHEFAHSNAKFELADSELEEDSFHIALQSAADNDLTSPAREKEEMVFNPSAMQSLKDGMAHDQFKEMIDSLFEKTDEILAALADIVPEAEIGQVAARSHELKGMAANFGLIELSAIAGEVERMARHNDIAEIQPMLKRLPDAADRGKKVMRQWAES